MIQMAVRRSFVLVGVFLFLGVLLAIYYCASPGGIQPVLRYGIATQQNNLQSESTGVPRRVPARPRVEQWQRENRVAICLVGGLRAFELTGPSIRKHLLDVYDDADLFVHAPADIDIHKLTLFTGRPHLASVRLFTPVTLNESEISHEVLSASGSPKGIQGLLQYFSLVEGCWGMIQDYEAQHDFQYSWVVRTRVDSYWNGPMPPLNTLNDSMYYVPRGWGFHGLNDRLGVGTRETSRVALQRLSLLPQIHQHGFRSLNSEKSFKAQFTTSNVDVGLGTFPFCVLSRRKYRRGGVAVASIASSVPLNGAKCRPCTPYALEDPRKRAPNEGNNSRAAAVIPPEYVWCDGSKGWERNWEDIYDEIAGPEMAGARQSVWRRSFDECIRDMELFQQQWEFWSAPSAEDLCRALNREPETETGKI